MLENLNQSRWLCLFFVGIVTVIGVVLRIYIASNDGLWLDELHTAWVTGDSAAVVAPRAAIGNQSELYFWLVWAARGILGDSVLALRAVSLVSGVLLILLATRLTWAWTRSTVSTITVGGMIAIDPQFVFYATEARPYGLVELLSVIQVILFWNWLDRFHGTTDSIKTNSIKTNIPGPTLRIGIALAIFTVLLLATHPTSGWLPITELLFYTLYLAVGRFRPSWNFCGRNSMRSLAVLAAITVIGCLPLITAIPQLFARRGNWASVSSLPQLMNDFRWPFLRSFALPIFLAAIFCLPNWKAIGGTLLELKNTQRRSMQLAFVFLWAWLPIAFVVAFEQLQIAPLALTRYTLVGAVAFPIFCGLLVAAPNNSLRQLAIAAIVIGVTLFQNPFAHSLRQTQSVEPLRFENWSAAITEINRRVNKTSHPVFLFSNLIEDVHAFETDDLEFQQYLRFPISGLVKIDLSQRQSIAAPTMGMQHFRPSDIELMRRQGGAWLIIRGDPGLVTEICNELRDRAEPMEESDAQVNAEYENELRIQFAQFPQSNVHLVSVDWVNISIGQTP